MAWTPPNTFVNGVIADATEVNENFTDLAAYAEEQAGRTSSQRGKCIIADEQSRTNVAYGTLTTPDLVPDLVIADGDLLLVTYTAMVKETNNDTGRVAVFIGANQLKQSYPESATPVVAEASVVNSGVGVGNYSLLTTFQNGLITGTSGTAVAFSGSVSTGQALGTRFTGTHFGGILAVEGLAAGTYDVSVQFKASAGTVTAKERKLRAWIEAF